MTSDDHDPGDEHVEPLARCIAEHVPNAPRLYTYAEAKAILARMHDRAAARRRLALRDLVAAASSDEDAADDIAEAEQLVRDTEARLGGGPLGKAPRLLRSLLDEVRRLELEGSRLHVARDSLTHLADTFSEQLETTQRERDEARAELKQERELVAEAVRCLGDWSLRLKR
jgi:hypothetical protein